MIYQKVMSTNDLIRYLDDAEMDIFELTNLVKVLGEPVNTIQSNIETLLKRGLLSRIEKGKCCRNNFRNQYVIGNYLAPGGAIAY